AMLLPQPGNLGVIGIVSGTDGAVQRIVERLQLTNLTMILRVGIGFSPFGGVSLAGGGYRFPVLLLSLVVRCLPAGISRRLGPVERRGPILMMFSHVLSSYVMRLSRMPRCLYSARIVSSYSLSASITASSTIF